MFDSFDMILSSNLCGTSHFEAGLSPSTETMADGSHGQSLINISLEYENKSVAATIAAPSGIAGAENKIWLTYHVAVPTGTGTADGEATYIALKPKANSTSTLAIGWRWTTASSKWQIMLTKIDWSAFGVSSQSNQAYDGTGYTGGTNLRIQVLYDISSNQIDQLWAGTSESETQIAAFNNFGSGLGADCVKNWSFYSNYIAIPKGSPNCTFTLDAPWMNDIGGDSGATTQNKIDNSRPGSDSAVWRVYGMAPKGDVGHSGWTKSDSAKNRFHCVDDFNDGEGSQGVSSTDTLSNDGVTSREDQLSFVPGHTWGVPREVKLLTSSALAGTASAWFCSKAFRITGDWVTGAACSYYWPSTAPDLSTWDSTDMDDLQAGWKANASATITAVMVDVLGTGMTKQAANSELLNIPVVGAFAANGSQADSVSPATVALATDGNSNRAIVVGVTLGTVADAVTSVTWNGQALTLMGSVYTSLNSPDELSLWMLDDPPASISHTVTVNHGSGPIQIVAWYIYNATGTFATPIGADANSGNFYGALSTTGYSSGLFLVIGFGGTAATPVTPSLFSGNGTPIEAMDEANSTRSPTGRGVAAHMISTAINPGIYWAEAIDTQHASLCTSLQPVSLPVLGHLNASCSRSLTPSRQLKKNTILSL